VTGALLAVEGLTTRYGKRAAIEDIGFELAERDVLLVLGHNGAGKTTLLSSIFGLVPPSAGHITYRGRDITLHDPAQNVAEGIAYVPQGHGIFPRLSVAENLTLGGLTVRDRNALPERLRTVHALFPILQQRAAQRAGTMSGGQQQMLAIGIALMHAPALLILDEPSIGLAPNLVGEVMQAIGRINREMGTTVVVVEQNIEASLPIAGRAVILKMGRKVYDGPPGQLRDRNYLMTFF